MKSENAKWILYNIVIGFAVYWLSNLILWYPWSVNETFGQVIMFTINPFLWGFASYSCIIRYPKSTLVNGALLNSIIFIMEAIASDLIFFGVIRNAKDKLMHVTTFYAWGFVACFPFIIYFSFRRQIIRNKKRLDISDYWKPLFIGLISFILIILIIMFNVQFG